MERVRGIGGVFFKSRDPKALVAWYREELGIPVGEDGGASFEWREADGAGRRGCTLWWPFPGDTDYFAPSDRPFMVNFRVRDLDAVLARLRGRGIAVDERIEQSAYGRFGWLMDPEGNRIELWQPPAEVRAPAHDPGTPGAGEFAAWYEGYVRTAGATPPVELLESQLDDLLDLMEGVPEDRAGFAYAPGKWTIAELMGHLGDGERVFGYRAACISRGDATPLPGFDENAFVAASSFASRSLGSLIEELACLRRANLLMFRGLSPDQWTRTGTANGQAVSVRALAYIIAGHTRHHQQVLAERYLAGRG